LGERAAGLWLTGEVTVGEGATGTLVNRCSPREQKHVLRRVRDMGQDERGWRYGQRSSNRGVDTETVSKTGERGTAWNSAGRGDGDRDGGGRGEAWRK
jgi:hypothetical protein